ncbi:hypothetical protein [Rhodoluna sp.]|uniref:hypothetical protein n=1 Tax=Rhodoluna sp. TaxID=1969481 RepID=UPI0025DAB7B4|nr:hypothetical protein [Rhodoluna sp.]
MTEGQFQSRRELREAERNGTVVPTSPAVQDQPLPQPVEAAPAPLAAVEVVANDEPEIIATPATSSLFLSRRQLRDFEKRGVVPAASPQEAAQNLEAAAATEAAIEVAATEAPAFDEVLAEAEEPITSGIQLFAVSPNLNIEPQTASIMIVPEDPLANLNVHITETGELLKTGSIELPKLTTNTGEISTILDASEVDDATVQDSISGYVSTIAPLRASGVVNTAGKIGIMPTRLARGQGQIFAVLTASLLMVTVGGLLLAAYMLGLL